MEKEKIFKTKTGFCHVLPDKIVLTRDGIIGNVAEATVGNRMHRVLITQSILSICFLYFSFTHDQKGFTFQSVLLVLFGIFLVYSVLGSLNNSVTPIIERKKIKSIELKKALSGVTRSRFVVKFEDKNGKIKKRFIILPGSLQNGPRETQKAFEIMKSENLL